MWGGGSLEKKPHLVKWTTICTEKKKGGLGLRNFSRLNKDLLCKWSWRFANEGNAIWRKVVSNKFGETSGVGTLVTSGVAMVLGCGRKLEKNDLYSSKMQPFP